MYICHKTFFQTSQQQHTSGCLQQETRTRGAEPLHRAARVATIGKHGKMPFKALGNIVVDAPPDAWPRQNLDSRRVPSRNTYLLDIRLT